MRPISILSLTVAVVLLASCGTAGTTMVYRQRLASEAAGKLAFERVTVTSSVRELTQADLDQLRDAVLARVPQSVEGGVLVTLQLTVTDYAKGGSKMFVSVRVVDAARKSYAEFSVEQTANTLMGTIDQRSKDINAIADAVARSLMAYPVAPPATMDSRDFGV